jgi:putative MFS transporter
MNSKTQNSLLLSASSGFFMWGIIAFIGPSAAAGGLLGKISGIEEVLALLIGPIFILIGNVAMGSLSDYIGRKRVFVVTMFAYGAGLLLVVASAYLSNFILFAAGLAIAQFGIGGEEPPTLALLSENFSPEKRARYLALAPNYSNIGSAFIAGLFLVSTVNEGTFILASALIVIGIMVYARMKIPESFRWLGEAGKEADAKKEKEGLIIENEGERIKHPGYLLGVSTLVIIGIVQYLTFGLMAYVIGPYEFASATVDAELTFVAVIGASVAGFIAAKYIVRGRKSYTLWSYFGGFASMIAILALVPELNNMFIFLPLLFINMMMSEFAWVSRTTLEPEIFPTKIRATGIGLIRFFPMLAYIISIYTTASFTMFQFVLFNVLLWGFGFIVSAVWYVAGFETKSISLDYL